ncbi:MAG: hypothetical protein HKP12_02975 [Gammaproteobacteria bacterium]|nr:hypothetical protein [Gammaproteobacteria bacterium]
MITVIKTTTTTVLLSALLCTTSTVEARLKYYRYNAEIPMVETTLNMMVAMGVIEQIPGYLVHDGNPYSRLANTQYGHNARTPYAVPVTTGNYNAPGYGYGRYRGRGLNPYATNYNPYATNYNPYATYYNPYASNYYSGTHGYPYGYGDGYSNWNNPWGRQWASDPRSVPQLSSPWNSTWGDPWNNPQWTSPWNSTWGNPWSSAYGGQLNSPWTSPWGNRLNSPWANSWNYPWGGEGNNLWASPLSNTMVNPFVNPLAGTGLGTATPGYPGNLVSPGYTPGYLPGNTPSYNYGNSGTSSFSNDSYSRGAPLEPDVSKGNSFSINNISFNSSAGPERRPSASKQNRAEGTNNRRLNGLWIGDSGEMLGIRGDNFLWYDGRDRYANGTLRSSPTTLKVTRAGTRRELSMHYRVVGNELYTISRNGKTRTFQRTPLMQQSQLASELYASPSSYQTGSASPFASKLAPGPDNATGLTPYPGGVSDLAFGSLAAYHDQQSDSAGLKSNWGEKSPLWSPGARSAAGQEESDTAKVREASVYHNKAHAVAGDAPQVTAVDSADRSNLPIVKIPRLTNATTSKSAKTLRQIQQHESSLGQFHRHQQVASVAEPASEQRSAIWNSLIPISTLSPTKRNPTLAPSFAPFRSNLPVATDTLKLSSTMPDQYTKIWRLHSDGEIQLADATKYLFSYLREKQRSILSAAAPKADNGNIWAPTAALSNAEIGFTAPADKKAHSGNVWKPTAAFSEKQRKGAVSNVYYSAANSATDAKMLANSKVKKFAWAE